MAVKTEGHFIVEINIAKRELGVTTTKQIHISNRFYKPDELYSGSPEIWGILNSIGGLGQDMGEVLPTNRTGSITIDAIRGSYDAVRRLYDFIDGWVFINQSISLYSFNRRRIDSIDSLEGGDLGDSSDLTIEFIGKVYDYSIDIQGGTFTLLINDETLSLEIVNNRYPEEELISRVYEEQAFNSTAAIVIGESVQVKGIPYSSITATNLTYTDYNLNSDFGVGTTIDTPTTLFPIQDIAEDAFVTDADGIYQETILQTLATSATPVFEELGAAINSFPGATGGTKFTYMIPVDLNGYEFDVLTKISVQAVGQNNGGLSIDGDVRFTLGHGVNDSGSFVFVPIRNAVATKSKLSFQGLIRGAVDYDMGAVSFEGPVYINSLENLYLMVEETGLDGITQFEIQTTGTDRLVWEQDLDDNDKLWLDTGITATNPAGLKLYGYHYSPFTKRQLGTLVTTHFRLTYSFGAGSTGPAEPSAFLKEWVFIANGLTDDSAGVITGVPDKLLITSFELIKLLFYVQDGESFARFDETRFPTAESLALEIAGVETSEVTYRDLMLTILENSNSKLIPNLDGTFAFWTYGVEQEVVAKISERDCVFSGIETIGIEDILNKIDLAYGRRLAQSGATSIDGNFFTATLSNTDVDSVALYGERIPEESFLTPTFVNTFDTAQAYLDYKFIRYALERQIYTITVPFWKNNYKDIKLWDIIRLSHIDSPSHQGSTPPNQTTNLFEGDDWSIGFVLRNAKAYFFRVVGRAPSFDVESEEPTLELKLMILNNPNEIF